MGMFTFGYGLNNIFIVHLFKKCTQKVHTKIVSISIIAMHLCDIITIPGIDDRG